MAEIIVAGPALIAVIQISDRIVGLCKHYIETVQDYPSDLRTILVEISFLKTTLENLNTLAPCSGNTLDQSQGSYKLKDPIEECLRLVQKLEKLFPSDIQQSSNNTSKRQKVKATFAQLAWPLKETKARKLLDLIRPLKETFILELTSQSHQDIKEVKAQTSRASEIVTESQQQEIYRWLQHTDPSSLYYKAQQDYEPETGNWVSRSSEWLDWIGLKSRCLWIHGIPGAGKTVLISHMIGILQESCKRPEAEGCVCVYYFCFYRNNQDEGKPFLRWLINQLCRKKKLVPSSVLSMYNYGGEPSLVDLLKALEEILRAFKTVYVVVDALDESLPRHDMLEVVRQIVEDTPFRNVQLLASSRRHVDIEDLMEAISTPLSMDNDHVSADIRTYVQSSIRLPGKFKRFPTELLTEIEDALSKGAKGMFRWAVCQLDVLRRLKCEPDIIRIALKDLPKTLRETYDRILFNLPNEERFVVRCLFEWIRFYSGLYRHGIPCQILVQAAERWTSESNDLQMGYFLNENTIKELCGCLIKTSPEKLPPIGSETLTVNFAHYTVREYMDSGAFLKRPIGQLDTPERAFVQQPLKVVLEEVCRLNMNTAGLETLASLDPLDIIDAMFTDFNISCTVSAILAMIPMVGMIIQQEELFHLVVRIFDPSGAWFGSLRTVVKQIEVYSEYLVGNDHISVGPFWDVRLISGESPSAVHLLYLIAYFRNTESALPLIIRFVEMIGIRQLTQERLRFQANPFSRDESVEARVMDGSIIEAVARGVFDLRYEIGLQQLLDLGEDFLDPSKVLLSYIAGSDPDSPKKDQEVVIRKLLRLGADPNGRSQKATLLQVAAYNHDEIGVRLLLEAKADPNEAGSGVQSPWEEASYMSRYNQLFRASPLYISRYHDFTKDWESKQDAECCRKKVQALLLKHGAKSFLRPESALILRS